ncbi:MAG: hypothetical protein ACRDOZ_08895 [Nocardioides sp.]
MTESVFPLGGWAMEVQTLDLGSGEVTQDTRTWEQRATLALTPQGADLDEAERYLPYAWRTEFAGQ